MILNDLSILINRNANPDCSFKDWNLNIWNVENLPAFSIVNIELDHNTKSIIFHIEEIKPNGKSNTKTPK